MGSIIFYNSILLFSTFFVFLADKGKGLFEKRLFLLFAFSMVFLPSALRYDVGTDYMAYVNIYEGLSGSSEIEPGFYFVNWILKSLNADPQWVFAFFSLLFTVMVFKTYNHGVAWLLHFVIISSLWFLSLNVVRQAVAISFCMLAIIHLMNRRVLGFLLLAMLGSFFHKSAIFVVATGLLSLLPLRFNIKCYFVPAFFVFILFFVLLWPHVFLNIVEWILMVFSMREYAAYFSSERFFAEREFGTGIGVLANVLFASYFILNSKLILRYNRQYWIVIILSFLFSVSTLLAGSIIIFDRAAKVFAMAPVLACCILYVLPYNRIINRAVVFVFCCFLLSAFFKASFGLSTGFADPKINPYQSVFQR